MAKPGRPPTPFETMVFEATSRIPPGKVTTYGRLGREVGCGSSQAIGQALRRNPFAPEVPCHRVIRGDRTIGGFAGKLEGAKIRKKIRLLKGEGVRFDGEGRVLEGHLHDFSGSEI